MYENYSFEFAYQGFKLGVRPRYLHIYFLFQDKWFSYLQSWIPFVQNIAGFLHLAFRGMRQSLKIAHNINQIQVNQENAEG